MYFSTYLPSNENVTVSRQNLLEVDNPPFRVFLPRVLSQDFAPNDDIIDLLSGVGASTTKRISLVENELKICSKCARAMLTNHYPVPPIKTSIERRFDVAWLHNDCWYQSLFCTTPLLPQENRINRRHNQTRSWKVRRKTREIQSSSRKINPLLILWSAMLSPFRSIRRFTLCDFSFCWSTFIDSLMESI